MTDCSAVCACLSSSITWDASKRSTGSIRSPSGCCSGELAWVKVSGSERVSDGGKPFHDALPFAAALVEAAPQRVLWGTDFPHPNVKVMPNDGELVDLFAEMVQDEGLRKRILVDNPARLYWADVKASVLDSRVR